MGSSSVTGLETIGFWDNMSFDGTYRGGAMTTDGQLWIGSTSGRHVVLGSITAGPGIIVTNGSGTITIEATTSGGTVNSVSGTLNRITSSGGVDPIIDISASYVGQTSITTLGTITTGVWTGTTIAVANGGTGATTLTGVLTGNGVSAVTASTVTQNGVIVGGASNALASTSVGSTGQFLQGNSGSAPTYSTATLPSTATGTGTILRADGTNWVATTATYPATTTVNQLLYSSATNVIGGVTAVVNGVLVSDNAAGVPSFLANGTAGYVLTAQSGAPPAWNALASGGITWTDQSGAFAAVKSNGYFITTTATSTLPAAPAEGDTIGFNVDTANILTIQANTGQFIRIANAISSSAGTAVNTLQGDAVTLI